MVPEIYGLVIIDESKDGCTVRVLADFTSILGLQIHAQEADSAIQRALKKSVEQGARDLGDYSVSFNAGQQNSASSLAEHIRLKLNKIASRTIDRKNVERALKITSKESARWTKDGRLPRSGNLIINRGKQRVQVSTYAPASIAELVARPEVIAQWRNEDKSSSDS